MSFMYSLNFRTKAIYILSLSLSMIYENKQHNILNKGHKTDSFRKSFTALYHTETLLKLWNESIPFKYVILSLEEFKNIIANLM